MRQISLRHVRTCKQSEKEGTRKCQFVLAVRNEKDLRKAILKIAYYDGTAESVLDNTFILDVLITANI